MLALLTFGAVLFYTSSASSTGAGDQPVVVAAHDLPIRVPILPGDLAVILVHTGDVPPGAFARVTDLKNVVAAITISKGQAVTSNLLLTSTDSVIGPQSAFLPIPAGFVAETIPTGEMQGVAGYIQVGDYVSLVAQVQGKTAKNVRTVYTNIPVIRIGAAPAETPAGQPSAPLKQGGLANSLTIVVTQCQAEFIGWFIANASLSYTLESYHDYRPQDVIIDPGCPNVGAAKGVTAADVAARWPGIST